MKKIVILGAGTAGTMLANHLNHYLTVKDCGITIIDEKDEHHYQPFFFLSISIHPRIS
jgi:sulfide:quinone oxidoreductase